MSEWKEYKLEEITSKIGSGATPKGGSNNYKETGISLIRSQNVLDFKFSNSGLALIDENQAEELKNVTIQKNDILFNITGDSVARCCIVPIDVLPARVNQHVAIIRMVDELASCSFVLYYLQYLKPELLINAEIGATRNAITKSMLEKLEITLPSLPEQRAIASVLSSLDDKIDLLHRQNATLEKMAETLFRQWFVEEAKEEDFTELGNVVNTTSGGTPSRSNMNFYQNGTIDWVKSKELNGNFILETEEKITNEAISASSAKRLPKDSVLIAMYGATVGEYGIISKEMTCNQAVCALVPNADYPYTYLFMLAKSSKEDLINMAVGSAQQNISQILIKQIPVSNNKEKIKLYNKNVEGYFQKIKTNQSQIRTLTQLRDTLLPKLMSGEVRVEI